MLTSLLVNYSFNYLNLRILEITLRDFFYNNFNRFQHLPIRLILFCLTIFMRLAYDFAQLMFKYPIKINKLFRKFKLTQGQKKSI